MDEDIIIKLQEHELGNDVETHELLEEATKEIKNLRNVLDGLGEAIILYLLDRTKDTVELLSSAIFNWESYKEG